LFEHLEKYHVCEDLRIVDRTEESAFLLVQGPRSGPLLQHLWPEQKLPLQEYGICPFAPGGDDALIVRHSETGESGFLLVGSSEGVERVCGQIRKVGPEFDYQVISPEVLDVLRLEAGIPRWGLDMDQTQILPETGLEQRAVSYQKGCYLGQEVVARVKTYGAVGKALIGLRFEGLHWPDVGSTLLVDGKEVGTVRSGTWSPTLESPIALAYLHRDYRSSGKTIGFESAGKSYVATITVLPFYQAPDREHQSCRLAERGMRAFAEGREVESIRILREAIVVDPKNKDAVEALGVILSRREEFEEAIVLMKDLAQVDPDSIMAQTNLSLYYMKLGHKEQAEEAQGKAMVLSLRAQSAKVRAEKLEREREAAERAQITSRLSMFRQVLELDANDHMANFGLGQGLMKLGKVEEGLPHLEKAVEIQKDHSVGYVALGKCFQELGKFDQAREVYARGIAVATKRGDLIPLRQMEHALAELDT
jgi:folate-binding protein YgfZ